MPKNLNYPLASFQKAFALADAVDALGGSCSVEKCAEKMQRKVSGGFMVIISSAQKFNLIGFEKGIIIISEDYKLIKHSYTNSERIAFLRKAFLSPQVFSTLYERFKGKDLPVEMLDKILIREFGVEENTANRIIGYFLEGLKTYGLLNGNQLTNADEKEVAEPAVKVQFETTDVIDQQVIEKEIPKKPDASFSTIKSKSEMYEIQLTGPGINTNLNLEIEEDFLILEAIIKKIRKYLVSK